MIDPVAILEADRHNDRPLMTHHVCDHAVWTDGRRALAIAGAVVKATHPQHAATTESLFWPAAPTSPIHLDLAAVRMWLGRILPEQRECPECGGVGVISAPCPTCDQEWERDCKECSGTGRTDPYMLAAFHGATVNARLLQHVLAGLPGDAATLQRVSSDGTAPLLFVGEGWRYVQLVTHADLDDVIAGTWPEDDAHAR